MTTQMEVALGVHPGASEPLQSLCAAVAPLKS